jgi:hypothetical protein
VREGYTFIAYGDDMVFLAEKMRDEMARAISILSEQR